VVIPYANRVLSFLGGLIKAIQDCRGSGTPLNLQQLYARFLWWRPEFLLAKFTYLTTEFNWGKPMRDPLNHGRRDPSPSGLVMPSTCSFDKWVSQSTYTCKAMYVGLIYLFAASNLEITGQVTDASRNTDVQLVDIDVRCIGSQCSVLSNATFCRGDADCRHMNLGCQDITYDYARGSSGWGVTDVVGELLWGDTCRSGYGSYYTYNTALCSVLEFRRNMHEWITSLVQIPTAGTRAPRSQSKNAPKSHGSSNTNTNAHSLSENCAAPSAALALCMVDPTTINAGWTQSLISRSGDAFRVFGLLDFSGQTPTASDMVNSFHSPHATDAQNAQQGGVAQVGGQTPAGGHASAGGQSGGNLVSEGGNGGQGAASSSSGSYATGSGQNSGQNSGGAVASSSNGGYVVSNGYSYGSYWGPGSAAVKSDDVDWLAGFQTVVQAGKDVARYVDGKVIAGVIVAVVALSCLCCCLVGYICKKRKTRLKETNTPLMML
jgi:hypothetical protein